MPSIPVEIRITNVNLSRPEIRPTPTPENPNPTPVAIDSKQIVGRIQAMPDNGNPATPRIIGGNVSLTVIGPILDQIKPGDTLPASFEVEA